jgi:chitodextrinase
MDRYPLMRPYGRPAMPPSVSLTASPSWTYPRTTVTFEGVATDSDGVIRTMSWDFGDGSGYTTQEATTTHAYLSLGSYTVRMTATDNSLLSSTATAVVEVHRPDLPPVVSFSVSNDHPAAGESVSFNASASYAPYGGTLVDYAWTFGDGSTSTGVLVTHAYDANGSYDVQLTVRDDRGRTSVASATLAVGTMPEPPAFEPISLVLYTHPEGFRLPVPSTWTREENADLDGTIADLVLYGPTYDEVLTNILVMTEPDSTVRETQGFLEEVFNSTIADIRQDDSGVVVIQGPTFRTIGNHPGVLFAVAYGTTSLRQDIAFVGSEAHGRFWAFILTVGVSYFPTASDALGRMLDGFVITLVPQSVDSLPSGLPLAFVSGGLVGAVGAVVALLAIRARRRARAPTPSVTARCPRCGTPRAMNQRFCGRCGLPQRPDVPLGPPPLI